MKNKRNPHLGSTLESFLKEEGIFEELKTSVIEEIIALRLQEEMATQEPMRELIRETQAQRSFKALAKKGKAAAKKKGLSPKDFGGPLEE